MKDHYYKQFKESIVGEIFLSERIIEVNTILNEFEWKFIHPYIQVFRINHIKNLHDNQKLSKEIVNKFFIDDFFNLDSTVSFIDGLFSRSKFINPVCYYIEQSLILSFQQDYIGAINIIIPAIESILSTYLKEEKGFELSNNRYDKIRKTIFHLKEDILCNYEKGINPYINENKQEIYFNQQQREYLLTQERKYFENWSSIIDIFLKDSLFAHSNSCNENELLNRHSIVHLLETNKYFTLENYIRLFNALKFLAWLFLKYEKKSILLSDSTEVYIRKRMQYEEIIKKSESLVLHKQAILRDYNLHVDSKVGHSDKVETLTKNLSLKHKLVLKILKKRDELKEKRKINNPQHVSKHSRTESKLLKQI